MLIRSAGWAAQRPLVGCCGVSGLARHRAAPKLLGCDKGPGLVLSPTTLTKAFDLAGTIPDLVPGPLPSGLVRDRAQHPYRTALQALTLLISNSATLTEFQTLHCPSALPLSGPGHDSVVPSSLAGFPGPPAGLHFSGYYPVSIPPNHPLRSVHNSPHEFAHFLEVLDLPQCSPCHLIHIAGTKGKGSTAAFCDALLQQQRVSTCRFTSPHLVTPRERIRLNGVPVAPTTFGRVFWDIWDTLAQHRTRPWPFMPSYFRYLLLMALKIMFEAQAEVGIIETGIGGRYDATRSIPEAVPCTIGEGLDGCGGTQARPARLKFVTGITSLGYDHMDLLGRSLEAIAWNKGGILRPGVMGFTPPQPLGALRQLFACAQEAGADLKVVPPLGWLLPAEHDPHLSVASSTLCRAWSVALRAADAPEPPEDPPPADSDSHESLCLPDRPSSSSSSSSAPPLPPHSSDSTGGRPELPLAELDGECASASALNLGIPGRPQARNAALAVALTRAVLAQRAAAPASVPTAVGPRETGQSLPDWWEPAGPLTPGERLGLAAAHASGRVQLVHDPDVPALFRDGPLAYLGSSPVDVEMAIQARGESGPPPAASSLVPAWSPGLWWLCDGAHTRDSVQLLLMEIYKAVVTLDHGGQSTRCILVASLLGKRSPAHVLGPLLQAPHPSASPAQAPALFERVWVTLPQTPRSNEALIGADERLAQLQFAVERILTTIYPSADARPTTLSAPRLETVLQRIRPQVASGSEEAQVLVVITGSLHLVGTFLSHQLARTAINPSTT